MSKKRLLKRNRSRILSIDCPRMYEKMSNLSSEISRSASHGVVLCDKVDKLKSVVMDALMCNQEVISLFRIRLRRLELLNFVTMIGVLFLVTLSLISLIIS